MSEYGGKQGLSLIHICSDAAMEAADVVLMDDDLRKISVGLRIAKNTRKIVMQNIVFALGIKILVLLLLSLIHISCALGKNPFARMDRFRPCGTNMNFPSAKKP